MLLFSTAVLRDNHVLKDSIKVVTINQLISKLWIPTRGVWNMDPDDLQKFKDDKIRN